MEIAHYGDALFLLIFTSAILLVSGSSCRPPSHSLTDVGALYAPVPLT